MIAAPPSGPFFHRIADSDRFCFFHAPAIAPADASTRGSVLAVHAFAEEMNKTRAATADAARAFAAAGFAVLQIDLTGCGDSAGDFEDATWAAWMTDLTDAWAWLALRSAGPRWLWGTRLGALLAEQFASRCEPRADALLLWQPVVSGAQHLNQFLRLKTVGSLLKNGGSAVGNARGATAGTPATGPMARPAANATTNPQPPSPRADLAAGLAVEIAGYRLNPALADAIESAQMGQRDPAPSRVRWFDVSSQPSARLSPILSPIAARVVDRWRAAGSDVEVSTIEGSAFWQTQEIERCDALVEASVKSICA